MEDNPQDRFVKATMKKLYSKNYDLDEFRIGSHKTGGCEICYEGGLKAIKHMKGGVKVYHKENGNDKDTIHIDIGSHNYEKKGKGKYEDEECDESVSSAEMERVIGGALIDKAQLPSSSMAGGKKKKSLNPKMKKRMEMVKKIMKEKGLSMIEASKYIKSNGIKY